MMRPEIKYLIEANLIEADSYTRTYRIRLGDGVFTEQAIENAPSVKEFFIQAIRMWHNQCENQILDALAKYEEVG
ncbi:MAG: hypothetical protein GY861_16845 [bacterium]|nr:hypothetical protein [bacterium]